MEINTETTDGVSVVKPNSEYLIAGNVDEFRHDVGPILDGNPKVVFDMSSLQFVDSSGIGAFLSCLRRVNAAGGDLKLFGITKQVYSVFHITRMHRIFDIFETREEAIGAFDGALGAPAQSEPESESAA
jgi:anti-sigma B factor antagonist